MSAEHRGETVRARTAPMCWAKHDDGDAEHVCYLPKGHDGPHVCGEDLEDCEVEWPSQFGSRDGAE